MLQCRNSKIRNALRHKPHGISQSASHLRDLQGALEDPGTGRKGHNENRELR